MPAINLFAMALSMLAALFGIAVATSSKRNPEPEEDMLPGTVGSPGTGDAAGRRKASMADKYLTRESIAQSGACRHMSNLFVDGFFVPMFMSFLYQKRFLVKYFPNLPNQRFTRPKWYAETEILAYVVFGLEPNTKIMFVSLFVLQVN